MHLLARFAAIALCAAAAALAPCLASPPKPSKPTLLERINDSDEPLIFREQGVRIWLGSARLMDDGSTRLLVKFGEPGKPYQYTQEGALHLLKPVMCGNKGILKTYDIAPQKILIHPFFDPIWTVPEFRLSEHLCD